MAVSCMKITHTYVILGRDLKQFHAFTQTPFAIIVFVFVHLLDAIAAIVVLIIPPCRMTEL